jgi:hypothetical protein
MRRWTSAGLLIGLPIAAVLILLFGGGRVQRCLGGTACAALPPVEGPPIIGTTGGLVSVLVFVGIAWLAVAALVLRRAWQGDRSRLRRSALLLLLLPTAVGIAASLFELVHGDGKRIAVETGVGITLLGASILAPVLLAAIAASTPPMAQGAAPGAAKGDE